MSVKKININQSELTYDIASDIYDVSYHNNGTTFASLSTLLSSENLSTLIPTEVRCGGMTIRFVQSTDNKYVQYRLMATSFSTTESDWQDADIIGTDRIADGAVTSEKLDEPIKNAIENISSKDTTDANEEQVWSNDDETEEYVKIGKYGIKAKDYLDIDGNPFIIGTDRIADGSDCLFQENKGIYLCCNPISNSTLIKKYADNIGGVVYRYINPITVSFNIDTFCKTTIGIWIRLSDNCFELEGINALNSITLSVLLESGETITRTIWGYGISLGWNLLKILSSIGSKIKSLTVNISKNPNFDDVYVDFGCIVINQRTFPTINFNGDATYTDDFGARRELLEYIYNNKIPMDFVINAGYEPQDAISDDIDNSKNYISFLRQKGLVNAMIYGNGSSVDFKGCYERILSNINQLTGDYQYKPIRICGNQHNFLNRIRFDAEIYAGIKVIRNSIGGNFQSSITKEFPIISTTSVYPSTTTELITDEFIENGINKLKTYIDNIVEFGGIGSIMTHQMVARNQYNKERDGGLCGIWEIQKEVMDYAISLRNQGKLNIISLQDISDYV